MSIGNRFQARAPSEPDESGPKLPRVQWRFLNSIPNPNLTKATFLLLLNGPEFMSVCLLVCIHVYEKYVFTYYLQLQLIL